MMRIYHAIILRACHKMICVLKIYCYIKNNTEHATVCKYLLYEPLKLTLTETNPISTSILCSC